MCDMCQAQWPIKMFLSLTRETESVAFAFFPQQNLDLSESTDLATHPNAVRQWRQAEICAESHGLFLFMSTICPQWTTHLMSPLPVTLLMMWQNRNTIVIVCLKMEDHLLLQNTHFQC